MPGEQRVHWRTARRDRTPSSREALQVVADGGVLHRGGVRGACERRDQRAVDAHSKSCRAVLAAPLLYM